MVHIPSPALSSLPSETQLTGLKRDLQHAQLCARRRGTAVLVRLHVRLPACDPWAAYRQMACSDSTPYFLWHDGQAQLCAAAWGHLLWRRLACSTPFAQAQAHWRELTAQAWDMPRQARLPQQADLVAKAPLAFAAFAFDNATNVGGSPWGALAGGALYVPRCAVYHRAAAAYSHGLVNHFVATDTDLLATEAQLCHAWQAMCAAASASASAPGSVFVSVAAPVTSCAPPPGTHAPGWLRAELGAPADWTARMARAQRALLRGQLEKVVLAREACFAAPEGEMYDTTATASALRAHHPQAVTYALGAGDGLSFLGATPEVLLRLHGRRVQTQAVAGTAPRGQIPHDDAVLGRALMHSDKDRREHALVVAGIQAALDPLCTRLQRRATPRLLRLARLQHLETPFTGALRQGGDVLQLCARLHPTPATGGWPRRAAAAWLAAYEPLDRGLYAGPIGWLAAGGDGTFAVALRSMLLGCHLARAYAGAGIVAGSQAAMEWQETQLKLSTARDALRLRPDPATHHSLAGAVQ